MSSDPVEPRTDAADLARERAEVERLRGILVERDAELGALRGRLLQLETAFRLILGLRRRLRALPGKLGDLRRGRP